MQFKRILILDIIVLLSGLSLSNAQQVTRCLAVITEINGSVLLKKVNKADFEKAYWGTQLIEGDQIKTSDKSGVKLLYSNNTLISLDLLSVRTGW